MGKTRQRMSLGLVNSSMRRMYNGDRGGVVMALKERGPKAKNKIVTPDMEKSFSKNTQKLNDLLATAVREGVIKESRGLDGGPVPVSNSQQQQQNQPAKKSS